MKELEILIHAAGMAEPKLTNVAEDATVEELLKLVQQEAMVIDILDQEILLLVEDEPRRVRKEDKLCDHGVKHGHHLHFSKPKHIFVAVFTTSGICPAQGYDNVPSHQAVNVELHHAAKKLGISDTTNWVAKVDGRELASNKNYIENGLHHKVRIDYGPRAGGGGDE